MFGKNIHPDKIGLRGPINIKLKYPSRSETGLVNFGHELLVWGYFVQMGLLIETNNFPFEI